MAESQPTGWDRWRVLLGWSAGIGAGLFAIASGLLGWDKYWQLPVILLLLFVIVRLVSPIDRVAKQVGDLHSAAAVRVHIYENISDLYADLRIEISRAKRSLNLTHIYDSPPPIFAHLDLSAYFDDIDEWVRSGKNRSVHRIISCHDDGMRQWAGILLAKCQENPRFHVKVVDWAMKAPPLNLAIIDQSVVFIVVAGHGLEQTVGMSIHSPIVAGHYLQYYELLLSKSTDLDESHVPVQAAG